MNWICTEKLVEWLQIDMLITDYENKSESKKIELGKNVRRSGDATVPPMKHDFACVSNTNSCFIVGIVVETLLLILVLFFRFALARTICDKHIYLYPLDCASFLFSQYCYRGDKWITK